VLAALVIVGSPARLFLVTCERPARLPRACLNQCLYERAILGSDHGEKEAPRNLLRAGPGIGEGGLDTFDLQRGQFVGEPGALRRREEQPLAAVLLPGTLNDEA